MPRPTASILRWHQRRGSTRRSSDRWGWSPLPITRSRPMRDTITIPAFGPIVRHALPNLIECNLVPVGMFILLLNMIGTTAAIIGALGWTLIAVVRRRLAHKVIPGLLVLTSITLTVRSLIALATGSLFVYFIQPTAGTALVGLAFFFSVPMGQPLAERLAHDLCPFDEQTRAHPALRLFLARVSVLWAVASMINFAITLWLLLTQTATTFLLAKALLGPAITVIFALIAVVWFRRFMANRNTQVIWRRQLDFA